MTPQAGTAARGAGTQVATLLTGTTLVQALGLLVSPIVARVYGPQALGMVTAAGVLAAMVATIAPLALDAAIVLVDTDDEARDLAGFVVASAAVVGVLSAGAVWGLAWVLPTWQSIRFVESHPVFWSGFVGATAMLTCYVQVATSLAVRCQRFHVVSISRVTQSLFTQGLTLALGFAGFGAEGAAGSLVIGQAAGAAVLLWPRRDGQEGLAPRLPSLRRVRQLIAAHRRYPLYTYPHALLDSLRENAIVAAMAAGGGEVGLGYWALVARTVRGPSAMLGAAFSQVFTARASASAREQRPLEPIMRWVLLRLGAASLLGTVTLAVGGPVLFALVFGEEWREAGNVARAIMPWIAINLVASPFAYLAYLLKINRPYLAWAIFYDLALIAVCAAAPSLFGFIGVVASISVVGTAIMIGILAWQYRAGRRFDARLTAAEVRAT